MENLHNQDALLNLPRDKVGAALLDALRSRPTLRLPVIAVLKKLKCNEALDPLVEIASQADPALYDPALDGLRAVAEPGETEVSRLVELLLGAEPGRHRDEVEKTILIVCDKLPANRDRSEPGEEMTWFPVRKRHFCVPSGLIA